MRDLGDTNDLAIFPLWFYTMDKGDYSILKRFVEKRYNPAGRSLDAEPITPPRQSVELAPSLTRHFDVPT